MAFALAGCASGPPPMPGEPAASVTARLGQPSAVYSDGAEQLLEYATGPMGQRTWMARIGADGRLRSFAQVLTSEQFATLRPGHARKHEVLRALGRPTETSFLSRQQLEVWSYRYKEADVWNSMMHVHFDRDGVVQLMQNGPDPMYEERRPLFR